MIRVLISFRVAVLTLLAVFVFTGAAWAQNAGLSGAVLDASGGSIAGAQIVLTNEATGASREATSGEDGKYVFAQLPPAGFFFCRERLKAFALNLHPVESIQISKGLNRRSGIDSSACFDLQERTNLEALWGSAGCVYFTLPDNSPTNCLDATVCVQFPGKLDSIHNEVRCGKGVVYASA